MDASAPPPEIPGERAEGPLLRSLREEVSWLLGRGDNLRFPGAQPVSFSARHLAELQTQDYYVCEKSDGIRCLMYLTADSNGTEATYLIDRKNDYYRIPNLHFPTAEDPSLFHTRTLVDGELVLDRQRDHTFQLKYLVFDCLLYSGTNWMPKPLDKRIAYFIDKVHKPHRNFYAHNAHLIPHLPFHIERKDFKLSYGIDVMFREVLPNLPHGNDGLIFTCVNSPYHPGTDPHILKWKKAQENSIDFLLILEFPLVDPDSDDEAMGKTIPHPDYSAQPTFHLSVGQNNNDYIPYGTMYADPKEWDAMMKSGQRCHDRIVECFQDEQHRWRFLRWRDDKDEPNHISTVESVIESIQDRIEERDLIAAAKSIRDAWKRRAAAAAGVPNGRDAPPAWAGPNQQQRMDSIAVPNGRENGVLQRQQNSTPQQRANPHPPLPQQLPQQRPPPSATRTPPGQRTTPPQAQQRMTPPTQQQQQQQQALLGQLSSPSNSHKRKLSAVEVAVVELDTAEEQAAQRRRIMGY